MPERFAPIAPGTVLDGKYQIVSLLGAGGMGEVFKVRHIHLNATRTIKVMKASLLADEWHRSRFLREARLATQVQHPNVAVLHDFATLPNGSYYMVSEFIDGITVRQWIKRYGRFPLPLAVEIALQVLSGLGHCHRRGLLHRDISPDNIMISVDAEDRPVAKIIDLGIAKDLAGRAADATQTGLFMGNPKYCSPEQLGRLEEGEELDLRSDLYSMGMVLYEMVVGVGPFRSNTPHGYLVKQLTEKPPPLAEAEPQVAWPPGFEAVLFKVLEKDRASRYRSAKEFAEALKSFGADLSSGLFEAFGYKFEKAETRVRREEGTTKVVVTPPAGKAEEAPTRRREARGASPGELSDRTGPTVRVESGSGARRVERRSDEARALKEIRELEERRDLEGLEALIDAWSLGSRVGTAAGEALARLREVAASEKREEAERHWTRADAEGSEEALQGYLERYPESARREDALRRISEVRSFKEAAQEDTQQAWNAFLQSWPESRYRGEAERRIQQARESEAEALDRASGIGSAEAYREFLKSYPASHLAAMAQNFLQERVAFDAALERDTERSWEEYLSRWPSGRNSPVASKRLQAIRKREEDALREAIQVGTSSALKGFLERFPDPKNRSSAEKHLREAIDFERAGVGGKAGWERFVKSHPNGRHAAEAKAKLGELEEAALLERVREHEKAHRLGELEGLAKAHPSAGAVGAAARQALLRVQEAERRKREEGEQKDWERAVRSDTTEAWKQFIEAHSDSPRVKDARQRLADVQARRRKREEEERDWERAVRSGLAQGWQEFIEAHPDSSRVAEARRRFSEAQAREKAEHEERDRAEKDWEQSLGEVVPIPTSEEPTRQILLPRPEDFPVEDAAAPSAGHVSAGSGVESEEAIAPAEDRQVRLPTRPLEVPRPAPGLAGPSDVAPIAAARARGIAPRATRGTRLLAAAGVLLLLTIGVVWLANRKPEGGGATGKETRPAEVRRESVPTRQPAPPSEMGFLVIDALPWGQVDRVEDAKGKNWLNGSQQYTPLGVRVPPGKYSVVITNANFPGRTLSLSADIRSRQRAVCAGRFEPVDPKAYFAAEGWGP